MRGLTLIELLLALAVTAALAGIGAPALRSTVERAQLRVAAQALLSAAQSAHQLALSTGRTITLCSTTDGATCGQTTGGSHWVVTQDDVVHAVTVQFDGLIDSNRRAFEFRPWPRRSTNGSITLCGSIRHHATIIVSYTGRARMQTGSADNQRAARICNAH